MRNDVNGGIFIFVQRYLNGEPIEEDQLKLAHLDSVVYTDALNSAQAAKASEKQRKMKLPGKRIPESVYVYEQNDFR